MTAMYMRGCINLSISSAAIPALTEPLPKTAKPGDRARVLLPVSVITLKKRYSIVGGKS
jgi:hypothetical protein